MLCIGVYLFYYNWEFKYKKCIFVTGSYEKSVFYWK